MTHVLPGVGTVTQPYDRIPMWHRHGSFTVISSRPGLRVATQDWSELTLEIFPGGGNASSSRKQLHERDSAAWTELEMRTDGDQLTVTIGASEIARSWSLRVHLRLGQRVTAAEVDGRPALLELAHIAASQDVAAAAAGGGHFPFGGTGTAPATGSASGPIAELRIERAATARAVTFLIGS